MLASTLSQILGSVILIAVVQPYFLIACGTYSICQL